jgi:hypothetical protein
MQNLNVLHVYLFNTVHVRFVHGEGELAEKRDSKVHLLAVE